MVVLHVYWIAITIWMSLCDVKSQIVKHRVQIENCEDSYLDISGVERCVTCKRGFSKIYEMSSCTLASVENCLWISDKWGCLECSCGFAVNQKLNMCVKSSIEGCLRLDESGNGCLQPKLGYTITYSLVGDAYIYGSIAADQGTYCGWKLSGSAVCGMCLPGFFMEASQKSCKKLGYRLQNEHTFWLTSNDMTNPITAINFIPGWENWVGKTNAGGFENLIPNCLQYDMSGNGYPKLAKCLQCIFGMIITRNQNQCVQGHPFCSVADDITHRCSGCIDPNNYWVDEGNNKCIIRDHMFDDCLDHSINSDSCIKCIPESGSILTVSTGLCEKIAGCSISDGINICLTCQEHNEINPANPSQCVVLPPNCTTSVIGGIVQPACISCSNGFYLWSSICWLMTPNCNTMDSTSPMQSDHFCNNCISGFHLVDNRCFLDIPFCQVHSTSGTDGCLECKNIYVPSVDGMECLHHNYQFQRHCRLTDGKGNCQQCLSLKFLPHCLDITNSSLCLVSAGLLDQCIRCLPSAILNGNICQLIESTCLRTNGVDRCEQCVMGYSINTTTFRCDSIEQCINSNGVSTQCLACHSGLILTSTGCSNPPTGCSIAIFNGSALDCIQCLSGWARTVIAGIGTCTKIANCSVSSGADLSCFLCDNGFERAQDMQSCSLFNPNPALQPPSFCFSFNLLATLTIPNPPGAALAVSPNYGICVQCAGTLVPRFSFAASGTSLIQECVELSTIGTLIYGCLFYSHQPGQCYTCQSNFHLNSILICIANTATPFCLFSPGGTSGTVCSVCIESVLFRSGGTCILNVPNCLSYNTTSCLACQPGFIALGALCVPRPGQQCNSWNSDYSSCTSCNAGFDFTLVDPNICLFNPHRLNCLTPIGNQCAQCNLGFILVRDPDNHSYCLSLSAHYDLNCLEYNASSICSQCKTDFVFKYAQNNLIFLECVPKNIQCLSIVNSLCADCSNPLYLENSFNSDGCVDIPNCRSPPPGTGEGCLQCEFNSGYYLDPSGLLCTQIGNCIQSIDGRAQICSKCDPLMFPTSSGQCTSLEIEGCIDSTGFEKACSQCTDKYFLDSITKTCLLGMTPNCLKFSPPSFPTSATVCYQCSPGFKLITDFTCSRLPNCKLSSGLSNALCTSCEDTYYLDTATGNCHIPDPLQLYCQRFTDNTQVCTQCEQPFYLDGSNVCIPRTTRNDYCISYIINRNSCSKCSTQTIGGVLVQDINSPRKGFCNPINIFHCNIYLQNQPKCQQCNQSHDALSGWLTPSANFCRDVSLQLCLTVSEFSIRCTIQRKGYYKYQL